VSDGTRGFVFSDPTFNVYLYSGSGATPTTEIALVESDLAATTLNPGSVVTDTLASPIALAAAT
jgi:hypothetical protein